MAPVEQQAMVPVGQGQMMPGPTPSVMPGTSGVAANPGTIPLSTLIDYIIQRTYHDLNVLSEL